MMQVFKTSVPVDGDWHELNIGNIVHVDCQYQGVHDEIQIWWENVEGVKPAAREFRVFGTGHRIEGPAMHIGSGITTGGRLVWHLYERPIEVEVEIPVIHAELDERIDQLHGPGAAAALNEAFG